MALAAMGRELPRCFETGPAAADTAVQVGLAAAAAEVRSPEAIRAVGALLALPYETVAEAAETALLDITRQAHRLDQPVLACLDRELAAAARGYEQHRRRRAMQAVAIFADRPGPELAAWLAEEDHPAHMALRAVVRRAEGDDVSGRCVRLLARPSVAPAAMDRLSRRDGGPAWWSFLAESHLLLNAARRRRLRAAPKPAQFLPGWHELSALSAAARRGLPAWVSTLPLAGPDKAARLVRLLTESDPATRWLAVGALANESPVEPDAREALLDYAFDRDHRVARRALISLLREAPSFEALRKLQRSPHEDVRAIAQRRLDDTDMWKAPQGRWSCAAVAHRRLASDRDGVVSELRNRVRNGDTSSRVNAIELVRRLQIARELELELLAAAAADDPRIVATAVRVLGSLDGDSAQSALIACASHADARVRANAVETLGASNAPSASVIEAMGDADPRTSANAIRARMLAGDSIAETKLVDLLRDDDPRRRISGLWVAERLTPESLAERVAHLARDDDDEHVRRRAQRCARRMLANMRTSWTRSATLGERAEEASWA